jgi:4-diphosphocytidyl-2-C-methyl-D-erythritol kinase
MISRRAHAKLNLALSVAPPEARTSRKPGWHAIASWMHAIDLHDRIEIAPVSPDQPSRFMRAWAIGAPRPSAFDWPIEKDLIFRAHQVLERHAGKRLPVAIAVVKSIPVGGGLGGGSADAAATLLALNELFALNVSIDTLRTISAALGSDVAFFLDADPSAPRGIEAPRPAIVTGFGDSLERKGRATGDAVLIFPPFGCATPAVYKAYDAAPRPLREDDVRALARGRLREDAPLFNDLALAACRVEARLEPLMREVARVAERPCHMTGSGSTLFIVARGAPDAKALASRLAAAGHAAIAAQLV